ncbi:alpha-2-macroglobulin family protein [Mucilaginibacter calamicampi]|uniref:Alpha-2-macroglobulin family protein n=1 Tax=Mucilaginibacter calamicampi TaxID=1302352 RepID=A0ABW2YVA5_9SPHI
MRKTTALTIFGILIFSICAAQKPLSSSRRSSLFTYIYKCADEGVLRTFKLNNKIINDNWFKNPIDSFKTDSKWNNTLPPGNYFLVFAAGNKLKYELVENHSAWLKVLQNNVDTRFIITDVNGKQLNNITVRINNSNVAFDETTGTYHASVKEHTWVRADYAGVSNYFILGRNQINRGYTPALFTKRWFSNKWYRIKRIFASQKNNNWQYRQRLQVITDYRSFIVFNKPLYKPRDTVKFKAFILDKHGKPINTSRLLLRIQNDSGDDGKVLGYVNSYRKGGFESNFVLTDSLDLDLDEEYFISLEDPSSIKYSADNYDGDLEDEAYLAKRKVFAAGKFRFEEYELESTNFSIRTDKTTHEPGTPLSVYLKAVDENDLPVQDGRVELTLIRTNQQFKAASVFVPDTLWTKNVQLEPIGETKVMVPNSIFPKADITYNVRADFLNSNNEHQSAVKTVNFNYNNYTIRHELLTDTLKITAYIKGRQNAMQAKMYATGEDVDTISKTLLKLPAAFTVNPNVSAYHIETDSIKCVIDMNDIKPEISLSGYRTADSLFMQVTNPHKISFWYWISNNAHLYDAGNNSAPFYKMKLKTAGTIRFSVSYIWAGKTQYKFIDVVYADKMLNIDVKQPLAVYPGQQINTEITVTNADGKPVANADLTAWSLTRKFANYNIPYVPYLGKIPGATKINRYPVVRKNSNFADTALKWEKWRKQLKLDTIEYYRFTHPDNIYKMEETAPDSITQVAPFVIRNGEIRPVNILYIDAVPVYFDQAQQMQRYSFRVTPGKHSFKFRTADENIVVDTVFVKKGIKLIFSVKDTIGNPRVNITKAQFELDNYEADSIDKYMIMVTDNFGAKMTTIEQDNTHYLINQSPTGRNYNGQILIGPLLPNTAFLSVKTQPWRSFTIEPHYSYLFEPGLLKQKSITLRYPFSTFNLPSGNSTHFTDYPLTQKEIDAIWLRYLDLRSHTTSFFSNSQITDKLVGNVIIQADDKNNPALFVKNIIIYRKNNPDYMRVYPGNTKYIGMLAAGDDYRFYFLLANNAYYIADNISVKANGVNYYNINLIAQPADEVSKQLDDIILDRSVRTENSSSTLTSDIQRMKETFNEKYLDIASLTESMSGRVTDRNGEPITGVYVFVKGTTKGAAVTDGGGQFTIKVPRSGTLTIRYVGFGTKEVDIRPGTLVNIVLYEELAMLNEVVVVGYGTQKRSEVTGAVSFLQGKVAGISIRGNGNSAGGKPLIIIDGVPAESMDGIAADSILETNVLQPGAATGIYGARAANGVIVITTKKKAPTGTDPTQPESEGTLRKNFSDYAYWQPKLVTDAQGKASFKSTFPDDITNWRTFVAGIGPQKQSGSAESQIKSFKQLSANLVSPLFAVTGDEMSVLGKVLNYTTTPAKINRVFKYNNQLRKQNEMEVANSLIDTFNVVAAGKDSLTFEYTIKKESGYYDGEQRKIPLVQQGVTETKGVFEALNTDTTVTLKFDAALGPVTFRAEASVLPTLAEEARRLREYRYLCNEQLASKLKGLLAEKRISTYLGEPFKWDKNIAEVIKKLDENRKGAGLWGWWKDTDEELWISLHAIEALTEAKKMGYAVKLDINKLTDYLVYQVNSYKGLDKILCVQTLRNLDAKVNYQQYTDALQKDLNSQKQPSNYDIYRLMLLQLNTGATVKTDGLLNSMKRTLLGNVYWGESSYQFFDNSIQLTVLAYKIFKAEGKHPELLTKIRGYFLEQRGQAEWRNTYESALILETILPEVLTAEKPLTPQTITLSGAKVATISSFPYSEIFTPGNVTVRKTGTLPVYITGYQQFWNAEPKKESREFTVDTWFEKNSDRQTVLQGGKAVLLKAEITVKGDADYVMINIPIPAGCSYESKEQSWLNNEVHREYFKDRVSIFCRKLKQGKYTFSINLMPRYNGKYNLNPAKAEMMYFPVFYGREGMKKVTVSN